MTLHIFKFSLFKSLLSKLGLWNKGSRKGASEAQNNRKPEGISQSWTEKGKGDANGSGSKIMYGSKSLGGKRGSRCGSSPIESAIEWFDALLLSIAFINASSWIFLLRSVPRSFAFSFFGPIAFGPITAVFTASEKLRSVSESRGGLFELKGDMGEGLAARSMKESDQICYLPMLYRKKGSCMCEKVGCGY
jgi:hypothetical protein